MTTVDQEIEGLVTSMQRIAHSVNKVFVPDPDKVRDFKVAAEAGRRRRAAARARRAHAA